jgi:hypothetical protein
MRDKTANADVEDINTKSLKPDVFYRLFNQHVLIDEKGSRHELDERDRKSFMDNVKVVKSKDGEFKIVKGSFEKIAVEIDKAFFQVAMEQLESLKLLIQLPREKEDCISPPVFLRRDVSRTPCNQNF